MNAQSLWERYKQYLWTDDGLGFSFDISRMNFPEGFFAQMGGPLQQAFRAMETLEKGAIANPDENRMVGHYWLRAPDLAPTSEISEDIKRVLREIDVFVSEIHQGKRTPEKAPRFTQILVVGIGGSALGPQLVADALLRPTDPMQAWFCDNTDPDGIDRILQLLGKRLVETLTVVISKSGGTKETRNGMVEVAAAYKKAGLSFAKHAVAVTGVGSELDKHASQEGWLKRFPMWDWVGGRTSVLSAVGLLPAKLQGIDIQAMLRGAREMDAITRIPDVQRNPAARMALMWFHGSNGKGARDLVVLPYKDRLLLISRYLQQLIMESLGKDLDLNGKAVNQGLSVYGNKGSTDQHAYVQQLRDGVHNFFVTFIEVLKDRDGESAEVEKDVTTGDYLFGFLLGTRAALYEKQRESMTLTLPDVSPRSVGALIALYERAVGLYASLININAYHQPGVEAGKKAASAVLELQQRVFTHLRKGGDLTAEELARAMGAPDRVEDIYKILVHLSANPQRAITRLPAAEPWSAKFKLA